VPAASGGGQENPLARGQKISSPETPLFFARSPKKIRRRRKNFVDID